MVPPSSLRVPRARRYSGSCPPASLFGYMTLTSSGRPSHAVLLSSTVRYAVRTPKVLLPLVWPLSISLAATFKIDFSFSSSAYLDVSVQRVPPVYLFDSVYGTQLFAVWVSPFGYPRIDAYLQLPEAFRSSSRPSSAPDAKAFVLCSSSLEQSLKSSALPRGLRFSLA